MRPRVGSVAVRSVWTVSDVAGHQHNYQVVRRVPGKDENGSYTIVFAECLNPGCPAPNRSWVER